MVTAELRSTTRQASIAPAKYVPLAALPATAVLFGSSLPGWMFMWILAASIFAGLKSLTYADQGSGASRGRSLGYLSAWPGLDARRFLFRSAAATPGAGEWGFALLKTVVGILLLAAAAVIVEEQNGLLVGWMGMIGIVFVLHFGLFHLLSAAWRRAGVDAPPIMDFPVRSSSVGEFWGRRWNRAFRDVAHVYVFRPLVRRLGAGGATAAVFLISGVVHDVVISVPAGAGYGLPTLYFLIQGAGILFERSGLGTRLGLGRGLQGRLFCATVTIAPAGLLFHPPFVQRIVLPMLRTLAALA